MGWMSSLRWCRLGIVHTRIVHGTQRRTNTPASLSIQRTSRMAKLKEKHNRKKCSWMRSNASNAFWQRSHTRTQTHNFWSSDSESVGLVASGAATPNHSRTGVKKKKRQTENNGNAQKIINIKVYSCEATATKRSIPQSLLQCVNLIRAFVREKRMHGIHVKHPSCCSLNQLFFRMLNGPRAWGPVIDAHVILQCNIRRMFLLHHCPFINFRKAASLFIYSNIRITLPIASSGRTFFCLWKFRPKLQFT